MPFIQKLDIPQPKKHPFAFTRFEGGLNNAISSTELSPIESPELLNVIYNEVGSFETRPGLFKFAVSQIPEEIKRIFYFETSTIKCFLLSSDTTLFRLDVGSDTYTTVCSLTGVIDGVQKEDKFYFVDGGYYKEYDGTNIYTIRNFTSYNITDVRFGTGNTVEIMDGSLLPDYYNTWYIEIVGGNGYGQKRIISDYETSIESWQQQPIEVTDTSFTFAVSPNIPRMPDDYYYGMKIRSSNDGTENGQNRVVKQYISKEHKFIIDSPWDIKPTTSSLISIEMYVRKVVVDDAWDTIPDKTSVAYITKYEAGKLYVNDAAKTKTYVPSYLEISDVFKGAPIINMVDDCKKIILHKNRIWFANGKNPNIIYYTDLDNQYYVPANHFIASITNDGDSIVGLKSFNDVLTIFKKNSVFALYGTDYNDFTMKEVNVVCGAFNQDVIQQVGNYLLYYGTDGRVYSLYDVRTDVQKMMVKNISRQIDINKHPININPNTVQNALAVYVNNMYILAIDDKILVYNELYNSWLLWDNINPQAMFKYNNELLITNSNRYLYRMPFKPFYIEETIANVNSTSFVMRKGYINKIGVDFNIYINDDIVDASLYSRQNHTTISYPTAPGNTTLTFKYTSMLCYNDAENGGYRVIYHTKDSNFGTPSKNKKIRKIFVTAKAYEYFVSTFYVKGILDYCDVIAETPVKSQISTFGVALFGDKFNNRSIITSDPITINQRGKIIRFIIDMECNDNPICIYELNGECEIL